MGKRQTNKRVTREQMKHKKMMKMKLRMWLKVSQTKVERRRKIGKIKIRRAGMQRKAKRKTRKIRKTKKINQMMKRKKRNRLRRQRRMLRRQLEFRKRKLKSKVQKERHYQEQSEIDKAMTVGKQEDPCLVSPLCAE